MRLPVDDDLQRRRHRRRDGSAGDAGLLAHRDELLEQLRIFVAVDQHTGFEIVAAALTFAGVTDMAEPGPVVAAHFDRQLVDAQRAPLQIAGDMRHQAEADSGSEIRQRRWGSLIAAPPPALVRIDGKYRRARQRTRYPGAFAAAFGGFDDHIKPE